MYRKHAWFQPRKKRFDSFIPCMSSNKCELQECEECQVSCACLCECWPADDEAEVLVVEFVDVEDDSDFSW